MKGEDVNGSIATVAEVGAEPSGPEDEDTDTGVKMAIKEEQGTSLLSTPLRDLDTPDPESNQLHGLWARLPVGSELKLIYGLRALEPLAEHGQAAIGAALTLGTEILSALGTFLSRNPDTTLADLRAAAVSTLLDLRPGHEPVPDADVEPFRSPQVVLLEAAEMAQLRRARSAGTSEEIVHGAARMVHELWEFADELGRSP
ncbi:MAG: hypothetical protein GY835_28350, partial [bacterium]|nr:hypothetical protein [bacterium]